MLRGRLAEDASLCAVVKADGYGHGMSQCADAAIRGGAQRLAVATATEAFDLRASQPDVPILLMGALTGAELDVALQARAELTVWRAPFLAEVAERAELFGIRPRLHLKYDTGMGRLGNRDGDEVRAMARTAAEDPRVELAGVWTHFATADESEGSYLTEQVDRFRRVAIPLREQHPGLILHAANSAATLRDPGLHFDMVRCGVALYGLDPFGVDPAEQGLEPAMSLLSYVADVKSFEPGDTAGYGRTWTAERETRVGVLPIGYGDGVRRGLSNGASVLIGGQPRPLVGTISMDNLTVDLGPGSPVEPGEPAVLLGVSGDSTVLAEAWARQLGTINYEVTCGISPRVPRAYRR